jgi:hypothetical protein
MAFDNFKTSYFSKIAFYVTVLFLPAILMTAVEIIALGSVLSVTSSSPSKFLFFIVYFLPGLIMAKGTTDSWRRMIGVGIAYIFLSPAYYLYAAQWACNFGSNGCMNV